MAGPGSDPHTGEPLAKQIACSQAWASADSKASIENHALMRPGKVLRWSDLALLPAILVGQMVRGGLASFLHARHSLAPWAIWWVSLIAGALVAAAVALTLDGAARRWRDKGRTPPIA